MKYLDDSEGLRGARKIPAYQSAVRFAQAVNEFALKVYQARQGSPGIDRLHRKANLIVAKIAGGHFLGYGQEFLEENICLCREAKEVSGDCEEALSLLLKDEFETLTVLSLREMARDVIRDIDGWIEELEGQIYW